MTYSLQLLALVALLALQIVIVTPFKVLAPCKAFPRTSSVLNRHTDTALSSSRRTFLSRTSSLISLTFLAQLPQPARAVGPVKVPLTVKSYSARVCPPDRPIPGEKAMKGKLMLATPMQRRVGKKRIRRKTCGRLLRAKPELNGKVDEESNATVIWRNDDRPAAWREQEADFLETIVGAICKLEEWIT